MFTVTQSAQEQIKAYFEDNDVKPIRVFLSNGCGGSQLALALDEKRPSDAAYPFANFEFIIEQTLLDQAQPMQIDFGEKGFIINSSLQLSCGCSGCGTTQNCCG